jgi:hypothetical protein
MSQEKLPDAHEMFQTFFDRWYDEYWREKRGADFLHLEVVQSEELIGLSGEEACLIDEAGQLEVASMIGETLEGATEDWQETLELNLPIDRSWLNKFDQTHDREQIAALIEESDPEDFSSLYVMTCCELGAVIAQVLRDECSDLEWMYAWPFWDSALLHPDTGCLVYVFHWAIKRLSESGVDESLETRIAECVARY